MLATLELELVISYVLLSSPEGSPLQLSRSLQYTCNLLAEWVEEMALAGSAKTAMQAKWLPFASSDKQQDSRGYIYCYKESK
jgi:hypothetical protein